MILLHTALFAEAKPIIEYFKLRYIQKKPYRLYGNGQIRLIITGMGRRTLLIEELRTHHQFSRAINIGMAGSQDTTIPIGTLLCTTHQLQDVAHCAITTVSTPLDSPDGLSTPLVDMEADYFLHATEGIAEVYVFKIVSDHLDSTIPAKQWVWALISPHLEILARYCQDPINGGKD